MLSGVTRLKSDSSRFCSAKTNPHRYSLAGDVAGTGNEVELTTFGKNDSKVKLNSNGTKTNVENEVLNGNGHSIMNFDLSSLLEESEKDRVDGTNTQSNPNSQEGSIHSNDKSVSPHAHEDVKSEETSPRPVPYKPSRILNVTRVNVTRAEGEVVMKTVPARRLDSENSVGSTGSLVLSKDYSSSEEGLVDNDIAASDVGKRESKEINTPYEEFSVQL